MKTFLLFLLMFLAFGGGANAQTTIEKGRAIEIRILGVPAEEMNRVNSVYPVSEQGTIRMPFIGSIRAAGLSPESLARTIESQYKSKQIYTNPTIQVLATSNETVVEYTVFVGGHVRRPGPVRYNRGMTIYQAVQAAGGEDEFGAMNRVSLLRNGSVRTYNLKETKPKTILVEPNDTIEVPEENIFGN